MAAWWDVPPLLANDDLPPLPPRLETLANLAGPLPLERFEAVHGPWSWPSPAELTEVARCVRDGWHLPEPYAAHLVLPAAWPAEHRGWLPDRVPRVWMTSGDSPKLLPLTADDIEHDTDPAADELGMIGVDAPPDRRIWLLRSPYPQVPVRALLDGVRKYARAPDPQDVLDAAREVFALDDAAFDAWRRRFVSP
jgi:hypothetical protein